MNFTFRRLTMTQIDVELGRHSPMTHALVHRALKMLPPRKSISSHSMLMIALVMLLSFLVLGGIGTVVAFIAKIAVFGIACSVFLLLVFKFLQWVDQQFHALVEWWISLWENPSVRRNPVVVAKKRVFSRSSQKRDFLV